MVGGWELLDGIDAAAAEDQVGEFGHEGSVLVFDLVGATGGGPRRAIPYGGVDGHGLGRVLATHGVAPDNLSYRSVVDIETAHQSTIDGTRSIFLWIYVDKLNYKTIKIWEYMIVDVELARIGHVCVLIYKRPRNYHPLIAISSASCSSWLGKHAAVIKTIYQLEALDSFFVKLKNSFHHSMRIKLMKMNLEGSMMPCGPMCNNYHVKVKSIDRLYTMHGEYRQMLCNCGCLPPKDG